MYILEQRKKTEGTVKCKECIYSSFSDCGSNWTDDSFDAEYSNSMFNDPMSCMTVYALTTDLCILIDHSLVQM